MGYGAALVLAVVFARAGLAKLRDRRGTTKTFTAFGLPAATATAVPLVELALAVGLIAQPGWAAPLALALLAAFTVFLGRAVRSGSTTPCNCFGSASRAPVSRVDLWRNGMLVALAVVALQASSPTAPSPVEAGLLGIVVAGGIVLLRTR